MQRSSGRWPKWAVTVFLAVVAPSWTKSVAAARVLLAQVQPDAPPVVLPPQKNYALEILVVIVLFGAALHAVCRSSRRN